ncbi:MAG: OsmC family protein [Pseudorhodobacter sp.]
MAVHDYGTIIRWTGNRGEGTAHYRSYDRHWDVAVPGKQVIHCSNDPLLGGDPGKMNPEDLLLSALSACHMLWYLHYASEAGVVVIGYEDNPTGQGEVEPGGAGRFLSVTLRPDITVVPGTDLALAEALHARIPEVCFIARSVCFPVHHEPVFHIAE